MRPRLAPLVASALATAVLSVAARQQPAVTDNKLFQSGIEITSVTATVTDKDGHLVHDLAQEAFELYEDGTRQTITQFTRERVPVGLGVLLDISDSMYGQRIRDAREAVQRFLFDLLDPSDEFFLMAFNHKPRTDRARFRPRSGNAGTSPPSAETLSRKWSYPRRCSRR